MACAVHFTGVINVRVGEGNQVFLVKVQKGTGIEPLAARASPVSITDGTLSR